MRGAWHRGEEVVGFSAAMGGISGEGTRVGVVGGEGGGGDPTGVSSMMIIERGVAGRAGDGRRRGEEKLSRVKEVK